MIPIGGCGLLQGPADVAAGDRATELLRRWFAGDPPTPEECLNLLPDPGRIENRGPLTNAGYAAALIGAVCAGAPGAAAEMVDAAARAVGKNVLHASRALRIPRPPGVMSFVLSMIGTVRTAIARLRRGVAGEATRPATRHRLAPSWG